MDLESGILNRVQERVGEVSLGTRAEAAGGAGRVNSPKEWNLPGIAGSTRVSTDIGEVPAHLVRARDRLRTREGRYLPVLHIQKYMLDEEFLRRHPSARPVSVRVRYQSRAGNAASIVLSPAQLVTAQCGGGRQTEARADSISSERVAVDSSLGQLSYHVFDLGEPALIHCGGIWVRSSCD